MNEKHSTLLGMAAARIEELEQQRDELLDALEKYGRHSPKGGDICSTILGNGNECDCGLEETIAKARGRQS